MKKFFLFLLLAAGLLPAAAENEKFAGMICLNPSAECGIFKNKCGEWSTLPARVNLSYTDEFLILDADLQAAPGQIIKAAGTKDDDLSIFDGETFEFQIAPAGQAGIYYHFVYSPSGFLYSAKKRDIGWNAAGLRRDSRLSGDTWQFRLEVPFKAMNTAPPEKGEIWRVNLARNARNCGSWEYSSLSGASDYHNLQEYSRMVFGADAPTAVTLRSITQNQGGTRLTFAGKFPPSVDLSYSTESMQTPAVLANLQGRNGLLEVVLKLREGSLPMKTGNILRLELKNQTDGSILYSTEGILPADQKSDLHLDKYYYTAGDKALQFKCNLAPGMILSLRKEGVLLLRKQQNAGTGRISFSEFCGSGGPEAGRYILTLSTSSQKVSRVFYILKQSPSPDDFPVEGKLTLSRTPAAGFTSAFPFLRSRLLHNGSPYYLFCLSPSYPKNSYLHFENCANFSYYDFGNIRKNSPRLLDPPSGRLISTPATARLFPPEPDYMKMLTDYARKQIPAAGIHRICYEAQIPQAVKKADGTWLLQETDSLMLKAYQALKSASPKLLCSIQTDNPQKIKELAPACDIFESAFYTSSYAQNMFSHIWQDMEQLRREVPPEKPVIFWLGGTIPDQSSRTAEEIRYGVYLSILNGFSGNIIHMGHGFLPERRSRLWSVLSGLHAEIESFYPAFASGKDVTGLLGKLPKAFLCRGVRTAGGEILLIAVNTRPVERLLILPEANAVRDFLTGTPIPLNNGSRRAFFTAYEPRIFLLER